MEAENQKMFSVIRDFSGVAVNDQRQWSPAERWPVSGAEAGSREAPVAAITKASQ